MTRWPRASPSIRAARGKGWSTIEAPVDLAKAVSKADGKAPLVVDCLTLWLSNLMLGEHDVEAALARFTKALGARKGPAILVSNEVGGGIVPDSPLARDFRDKAGLHQSALRPQRPAGRVYGGRVAHEAEAAAMTDDKSPDEAERHRAKMANRKAAQDAEVASKAITEKGLLIVHTGTGKGKSTAAFGLVLRMVGNGGKSPWCSSSRAPGTPASEPCWNASASWSAGTRSARASPGRRRTRRATWRRRRKAWETAKQLMADPDLKLIVLDELNIALRYDYLPLGEVVETLTRRRPDLHVVVTGRNAKRELIEAADLVTEMTLVKHHFAAGVKAQAGIEF